MIEFYKSYYSSDKGYKYVITARDYTRLKNEVTGTNYEIKIIKATVGRDEFKLVNADVEFLDYIDGYACIPLSQFNDAFRIVLGDWKHNLLADDFVKVSEYDNRKYEKIYKTECGNLVYDKIFKKDKKPNESTSKKDISKKVNDLLSMMKGAGNILEDIKKTDPNFDAGYKIDASISRALAALEEYAKEQNKEFDFEDLKFANYKLVDDVDTSARNAWFGKEGNEEDSIHIYTPEFVNIDLLPSDDYKYIVIVEIFKDCEHYKTLVIDAKTWITDSEGLGIERNLKDMAEYISAWGFKDRGIND